MSGRGLFLDLDGTLADSVGALKETYYAFLDSFGASGSDAEFHRLNGPPLASIVETLMETHALPGTALELTRRYAEMMRAAHDRAPAAPGSDVLLDEARRRGWKVALVTSTARAPAVAWLAARGFESAVDAVVGGDEVEKGKPAPAPYLLALERTGCRADVSLAVEDSPTGANAAMAAGVPTVCIADSAAAGWPTGVRFAAELSDVIDLL